MNKKYIIWSIEHDSWRAPPHNGYVEKREDAGVYAFEEASKIVRGANMNMHDVPNEAMTEWQDMTEVLKNAKEIEESDDYDEGTKHLV